MITETSDDPSLLEKVSDWILIESQFADRIREIYGEIGSGGVDVEGYGQRQRPQSRSTRGRWPRPDEDPILVIVDSPSKQMSESEPIQATIANKGPRLQHSNKKPKVVHQDYDYDDQNFYHDLGEGSLRRRNLVDNNLRSIPDLCTSHKDFHYNKADPSGFDPRSKKNDGTRKKTTSRSGQHSTSRGPQNRRPIYSRNATKPKNFHPKQIATESEPDLRKNFLTPPYPSKPNP